ncbi:[FeFe] hydrogenase H-cluster radical SAM maturase HydE [Melioribacter sp. OK-6-Me]|uniref:[FeFe] hydrogenase H-cluster radical SAM maturase HydE n=1 Tax=unclassified Melioribacter TaxID=2627329 RepID=UPI003EDA3BDE
MDINELLNKDNLNRQEIIYLLGLSNKEEIELLFNRADEVRRIYCGDEIHLRGIIDFSNYCQQDCLYCGLRKSNKSITRYRMAPDEVVEVAHKFINKGIFTIVLQSGEDSFYDTDKIAYIIYSIKQKADVAITLSLGERDFEEYKTWKIAGADRYLIKHETANPKLYAAYHENQKLSERLEHIRFLKEIGYQVGSGNMIGLPNQTLADIADDILLCKEYELDMAAFGPFVPAPGTPWQNKKPGDVLLTLKTMAIARIVLKDVHIPATTALATLDEDGRIKGLKVGANVIMPDFTPSPYRENYQIYANRKCVNDDPDDCRSCLQLQIESIGRKVSNSRGDSLKLFKQSN